MRKSGYTIEVEGGCGEHLAYNTANGAFALLDEVAHEALAAPCSAAERGGEDAEAAHALARAGFLTELAFEEEVEALKKRFISASADLDTLALSLAPTYACNCRCPYCYEQDKETSASMMGDKVMRAVFDLVAERFAVHPFARLSVQWYGGDPSLALDRVEMISRRLISWCDEHSVAYDAMMLSNCARIDDAAAELLARCRVGSVLVTVDGPRDVHNVRRPTVEGDDAFGRVMKAVRALQAHGVRVDAMINLDKVTMPLYAGLAQDLAVMGVSLRPAKLNDYAHSFGTGRFAPPAFDLFTHDEFHAAERALFLSQPHAPEEFRSLLAPASRFCEGQHENYFVIDYRGDVYRCDGWMGDTSRSTGNLLAEPAGSDAETARDFGPVTFDPFADDMCRTCEILPQCWGNCSWERERCGWPCHPLKGSLPDYLIAWYASCDDETPATAFDAGEHVRVIAPALSDEELFARL